MYRVRAKSCILRGVLSYLGRRVGEVARCYLSSVLGLGWKAGEVELTIFELSSLSSLFHI